MKIHRVVMYIIDFDEVGADGVKEVLQNTRYPNRCISPNIAEVQTRDIGEWSDDHPLNKLSTADSTAKALFSDIKN